MRMNRRSQRAGFTLVEMLVVIVIIGVLAGLLIPAIGAARRRVTDGRIAIEISNVAQAVEAYKQTHGDYPPSDAVRLRKHILQAWPHITNTELNSVVTLLTNFLDAAEAIPFWFGGFSSDPKSPFLGPGGPLVAYSGGFYANPERNPGIYEFDRGRLSLTPSVVLDAGPPMIIGQLSSDDGPDDSFPIYVPKGSNAPLVYFDARSYGTVFYPAAPNDSIGAAKPYLSERADPASALGYEWANETTFQIISAGRDSHYGSYACVADPTLVPTLFPIYPLGTNYDPTLPPAPAVAGFPGVGGDNDNITNFSAGGTLEGSKP